MVLLVLEVRDRADHGLPSRLILDSAKVQDWIDRTSKKYLGHLFPIFDDPDSYFQQPMTDTTIANKKVVMKFVMPLQDHSEFFFKKTETKTLTVLESNTRIIQMTHRHRMMIYYIDERRVLKNKKSIEILRFSSLIRYLIETISSRISWRFTVGVPLI